jgi:hypothetical protein
MIKTSESLKDLSKNFLNKFPKLENVMGNTFQFIALSCKSTMKKSLIFLIKIISIAPRLINKDSESDGARKINFKLKTYSCLNAAKTMKSWNCSISE